MSILKKVSAALLSIVIIISAVSFAPASFAADSGLAVSYIFKGDEANLAGYAEGTVTVSGTVSGSEYDLYWSDENGKLSDCEKIAAVKANGSTLKYDMVENMAIPEGATALTVYKADNSENAVAAIPLSKQFNSGKLEMTFASVSDIHVNYNSTDPNSDNFCGAPQKWTDALNYFATLGLDMVVGSGDYTSSGSTSEFETYKAAVDASNYSSDKIYMSRGNHESQSNDNYIKYTAQSDMVRPSEKSPWFYVLKNGDEGEKDNLFIFMAQEIDSTSNTPGEDNFSNEQLDWLQGLLEQYSGTNTNIFIVQHGFYHNWGPGDRYDGVYVQPIIINDSFAGNMRFQSLMIKYKEAVLMSGHSHIAFSEMVNYSDEHGTACRMIHNSSTSQQRTYTSSGSISYRSEGKVTDKVGSEGYVVGVYANDIVYSGTNLTTRQIIPTACYIFPSYSENRSAATAISVSAKPDKTDYIVGEYFNPAGMEITATMADGTRRVVDGWGLENNLSLKESDGIVTVTYGDLKAYVRVNVEAKTNRFVGKGTFAEPYLIRNADDFAYLTEGFASVRGTGSHDTATFGAGMYFRQVADIDMSGYEGYAGINASSANYFGFSGVYDGNGYKIKVNMNYPDTSDVSIFPYINGILMNMRFEGTIIAKTNAQPIRTIGKNGNVINCDCEMNLTANDYANGLSVTNYGSVYQYYSRATVKANSITAFAKSNSGSFKYSDCYHYAKNSSGAVLDNENGTKSNDYAAVAAALNDHTKASIAEVMEKLKTVNAEYTDAAITLWKADANGIESIHNEYEDLDTVAPVLTITPSFDPDLVVTTDDATVTVSAVDNDMVTDITYKIGAGDPVSIANPTESVVISDLPDGNYKITVTATDTAGNTASGFINVNKSVDRTPKEITSDVYTIKDNYIISANGAETAAQFLDNINEKEYCKLVFGNEQVAEDADAATGMTLALYDGDSATVQLTVVIIGDIDGDGKITVSDVVALRKMIMSGESDGALAVAADLNTDTALTVSDVVALRKVIMNG